MFLHANDDIAKNIDVMDEKTGQIISDDVLIIWADFENHDFAKLIFPKEGNIVGDLATRTISKRIIPVYKGE